MRAGGQHSQHLDFLNRFSDPDHSFTQNLRAQAAAMHQARQDFLMRKSLQVRAWLTQLQAARPYFANPELFADQVIQWHAARDYVSAAVAESGLPRLRSKSVRDLPPASRKFPFERNSDHPPGHGQGRRALR